MYLVNRFRASLNRVDRSILAEKAPEDLPDACSWLLLTRSMCLMTIAPLTQRGLSPIVRLF